MRAGNFTDWSDKENVILFRSNGTKSTHNVQDILTKGKASEDPLLQGGDRISVPKRWFRLKD